MLAGAGGASDFERWENDMKTLDFDNSIKLQFALQFLERFEVDSRVFSNGSMLDNEYSNMPVMTDELARKIVDSVLGVW